MSYQCLPNEKQDFKAKSDSCVEFISFFLMLIFGWLSVRTVHLDQVNVWKRLWTLDFSVDTLTLTLGYINVSVLVWNFP